MEFKGLKINIIIMVMLVVLVVFFLGQHLFKLYNIDKPITEEIKLINGVEEITLKENDGRMDIIITFQEGTEFYNAYKQVEEVLENRLGKQRGKIIIKNVDIGDLDDVYYNMHYAIYEGLSTKQYVEMKKKVEEIAIVNKISKYWLWVDNDAVFLQLERNGHSLYHRFPHNSDIVIKTEGSENSG